ncbi:hypothetical protein HanRHA438_Chr03g0107871 [Helianthus annuus]|uniref:Uncharacterized protein n=1 Tax=Helianthus annuus TaxID=4232 RepID=A0A9K3NVR0_HELAN|nr:hypothetical protein HanXRQr2_Chr03g0096771 [Helianthus annuus]KAJ0599505.1 hypothetical protein HanIR_Chr03g0105641 [Helianthus annuus]KAJ0934476.1 hypothetical protein HanRHA438_Chr03g0107871 [Helianthus annuus]KAJ0942551.1 hypothetical protein HanPSC8_Chr03g0093311 [Helianthus annuus]
MLNSIHYASKNILLPHVLALLFEDTISLSVPYHPLLRETSQAMTRANLNL